MLLLASINSVIEQPSGDLAGLCAIEIAPLENARVDVVPVEGTPVENPPVENPQMDTDESTEDSAHEEPEADEIVDEEVDAPIKTTPGPPIAPERFVGLSQPPGTMSSTLRDFQLSRRTLVSQREGRQNYIS